MADVTASRAVVAVVLAVVAVVVDVAGFGVVVSITGLAVVVAIAVVAKVALDFASMVAVMVVVVIVVVVSFVAAVVMVVVVVSVAVVTVMPMMAVVVMVVVVTVLVVVAVAVVVVAVVVVTVLVVLVVVGMWHALPLLEGDSKPVEHEQVADPGPTWSHTLFLPQCASVKLLEGLVLHGSISFSQNMPPNPFGQVHSNLAPLLSGKSVQCAPCWHGDAAHGTLRAQSVLVGTSPLHVSVPQTDLASMPNIRLSFAPASFSKCSRWKAIEVGRFSGTFL